MAESLACSSAASIDVRSYNFYVQELGAEIAQLEKQRDELEAELKRVINLLSLYGFLFNPGGSHTDA